VRLLATLTVVDVQAALSNVLDGAKNVEKYVHLFKEKSKSICLIKINDHIPNFTFRIIHKCVKNLGGKYCRDQRLWEVPLHEG